MPSKDEYGYTAKATFEGVGYVDFSQHDFKPEIDEVLRVLLSLPTSLQALGRVLISIPKGDVSFESKDYRPSFLMRFQNTFELMTCSEWDWWPLQRPEKNLNSNKVRVRWKCLCGTHLWQDIAQNQSGIIRDLLAKQQPLVTTWCSSHACQDSRNNLHCQDSKLEIWVSLIVLILLLFCANWYVAWRSVEPETPTSESVVLRYQSDKTILDIGIATGGVAGLILYVLALFFMFKTYLKRRIQINNSVFRPETGHISRGMPARYAQTPSDSSGNTASRPGQPNNDEAKRDQPRQSTGQGSLKPGPQTSKGPALISIDSQNDDRQPWILLGVSGSYQSFIIDHLGCQSMYTDNELCTNLRASYNTLKGLFRRIFSVWKLRDCEVVKYSKPEAYQVFHDKNGLPYPSNEHETDYVCDGPTSSLTPHEFEAALNPCSATCRFTLFHWCVRARRGTRILKHIPKKKSPWPIGSDCEPHVAWGLRAREVPSALKVFVYQGLILIGPFAFWIWWMRHTESSGGDWQGAAVPASVVIALQSLFWTQMGVLQLLADVVDRT